MTNHRIEKLKQKRSDMKGFNSQRKSVILIVDDNEYGRDILKRLLITKGYQLAFAANGVEALSKAAKLTPDLILLDIMMPGMDGFEVCRRLRQDSVMAEVPIIMLTALDDPKARMQGIEAGADDFITKPFDRDELRARVKTILRLNRFRRLVLERAKFEWVVENADDGYLIIDQKGYVLYANPRGRLYLDMNMTGVENRIDTGTFLDIVRQQYQCEPAEAWESWPQQTSNTPTRYLRRPESPSSPTFWLQVDILNLEEANAEPIVRLRDVTEQMNLDQDMRGFHEAILHKFRTPVLLIHQNLELLAKHADKMSPAQMKEEAQRALQSTERLREQIRDVLQYVHAPDTIEAPAKFPLAELEPKIAKISQALGLRPVQILGLDGLGETKLLVASQTIDIIFSELLENAKKFHPQKNPTITIFISRAGIEKINLQICDDGIHLSPEQLAKAWNAYYQGEKYFTGEVKGMGLGLSLVAFVVRESNGSYRIANRKETPGVVVDITLPMEEKTELDQLTTNH